MVEVAAPNDEQPEEIDLTAQLMVRVPRNTTGDLEDGIATILDRIESVQSIDSLDVTGLMPGLNDIQTEVRVQFTVAVDQSDPATVRETLEREVAIEVETSNFERRQADEQ